MNTLPHLKRSYLKLTKRLLVPWKNRSSPQEHPQRQYLSTTELRAQSGPAKQPHSPPRRSQQPPQPPLRRKRIPYEQFILPQIGIQAPMMVGMERPLEYNKDGESSLAKYSEKASLSPWTPVPESVARKIFDRANPTVEDIHVELGSGDGRVNFHAMDAGVGRSIGIDVDPDIVQVAKDRLARIHPPPNIEFIVADLMKTNAQKDTENDKAWKYIQEATILTMYFAKDGLLQLRPLLETALRGKRCKIFTCEYPMPGWESQIVETVLDMPIHFYDWGNTDMEVGFFVSADSFMETAPILNAHMSQTMDKFASTKKKSSFTPNPLLGFHPDDMKDYYWDDFETPDTTKQEGVDQRKKR